MPRFSSVILDVDSTLSGIEGIDWLAARRGPEIGREVARLTAEAMAGEHSIEEVFGARLEAVHPTKAELAELAEAYWENVAAGAADAIERLRAAGVRLDVVTSGLRDAVAPFVARLGVPAERVHAVACGFDARGDFSSFATTEPLVLQGGKRTVAERLRLTPPVLAVGDGMTDAEIRPVADAFAAFTGFVRREPVVAIADFTLGSFAALERLVLGTEGSA